MLFRGDCCTITQKLGLTWLFIIQYNKNNVLTCTILILGRQHGFKNRQRWCTIWKETVWCSCRDLLWMYQTASICWVWQTKGWHPYKASHMLLQTGRGFREKILLCTLSEHLVAIYWCNMFFMWEYDCARGWKLQTVRLSGTGNNGGWIIF